MKNRFCKKEVAKVIWDRIEYIEKTYKLKSYNGWAQVASKGEEMNRIYGEYHCLLSLTNELDLNP